MCALSSPLPGNTLYVGPRPADGQVELHGGGAVSLLARFTHNQPPGVCVNPPPPLSGPYDVSGIMTPETNISLFGRGWRVTPPKDLFSFFFVNCMWQKIAH